MSYDEDVANRLRECVSAETGVVERRMFGGLAFLINGNLAAAASGQGGLMVRVDPALSEELVAQPGVSRMVMAGREMAGWLRIEPVALDDDHDFARWVGYGTAVAKSLPPK